jgi:uncharacterized protein (DUF433 family)
MVEKSTDRGAAMTATDIPRLGEGIYTFSEAAGILRGITREVSTRQLRYWMNTGLTPASHAVDGESVLSFEDLISLEIVRRLKIEGGASLQSIRKVEAALRRYFPLYERPFAHKVFFTDGADVWAEVVGEGGRIVLQLTGSRRDHYAWRDAVATFAKDIRFEGSDAHASRWHLSPWVEINPAVQFGAPVVVGTRVPITTIEANLEVGTPAEVADWYGLRIAQVEGVKEYLVAH